MSRSPAVARHEEAGRLEGVRVGVRYARDEADQGSGPHPAPDEWVEGPLLPGTQRLGPLELHLSLDSEGPRARLEVSVRNRSEAPVRLDAVVLGFRWREARGEAPRFLRHGWQSWSFTGGRALDEEGEPPFASGPWLRGLHHGSGTPPADRAGWHESDLVSVAVSPPRGACLLGLLERGRATGVLYLRPEGPDLRLESEALVEVPLGPGEELAIEPVLVALGPDENRLLEDFADALGEGAGARTGSAFQAGWCSWYQFFHDVTEEALLRNLEALAARRDEIPVEVVQLDDGYQRAIGDWLETNEKFPRGIAPSRGRSATRASGRASGPRPSA